jgi:glycine cleavage system H protein
MTNADIPEDRLYSDDHEWVAVQSIEDIPTEPVRVGISRVAADNLGDLVFIDLTRRSPPNGPAGKWNPPRPCPI